MDQKKATSVSERCFLGCKEVRAWKLLLLIADFFMCLLEL